MEFIKNNPETMSTYSLASIIVEHVKNAMLIAAVKEIKDWTGMGLYDAKRVVDIVREEAIDSYGYPETPLTLEDLNGLRDFTEGALVGVVTMVKGRHKVIRPDDESID